MTKSPQIISSIEQLKSEFNNNLSIIIAKTKKCAVCDAIYPKLEEISNKYNLTPVQIYIEDFKEFSGQYLVFTVPTVLVFLRDKEILRESRFINMNNIDKLLSQYCK